MVWDVFCKVIDNYGDLGVCLRLCCNLANQGEQLRLWVDDTSALTWMAPLVNSAQLQVIPWRPDAETQPHKASASAWPELGDVVIEAFGCELPLEFVARMAQRNLTHPVAWINLEYLTAEPYAEDCHGLPSPVFHGPGMGLTKHFFYPGFTPRTGGLLREPDLSVRQTQFDRDAWLAKVGVTTHPTQGVRYVSLFCYEPSTLPTLLNQLAHGPARTHLLVTAGRATEAVKTAILTKSVLRPNTDDYGKLSISYLPTLRQQDFDHLLWACDLNFVRGEDSLVRAIWAGKPFVWHIYPQDDNAHHSKLHALLDMLDASSTVRAWHRIWNGLNDGALPTLDALLEDNTHLHARARLQQQTDLCTQLRTFVAKLTTKSR